MKKEQGITLIALVVTIVVLLILAGITINMLFSNGGIFKTAGDAANAWNEATINEQESLTNIAEQIENLVNGQVGGTGENDTPNKPEVLETGSTITYNPSGTYNWKSEYYTIYGNHNDVILNSSSGEDFNISSWKILNIDQSSGYVELVPIHPTTGTVSLECAPGYNNGVKLLNEACSNLYGDDEKGITARSINIEDIEKYMTEESIIEAHSYKVFPNGDAMCMVLK